LELPPEGAVAEVFKLYDRVSGNNIDSKNILLFNFQGSDGQIDFREFLIGLSLLSQPANNEETLKIAFTVIKKIFQTCSSK
jgi:hypothetical protein